ncbi:MAG: sulfotransferase [Burkholderiaceae bacterium]|nr:sulfotransferase [Burkholderiaceae bacterium]
MMTSHRNKAIIVLGMHRSGTSALAGVLNLLGVHPGGSLIPALEDNNPKGFWEHAEIVPIHDNLLATLGSYWADESPLPSQWWHSSDVADFRSQIVSILRRDFRDQAIWLIKDPRMCRLLPMWHEVFRELACQPLFILAMRNPVEVTHSLVKRNNLNEIESCLLWLIYMLEAESQTRDQVRIIVNYERLLADWRGTVADIADTFSLTWPLSSEDAALGIDTFLDPSLRHHGANTGLSAHLACRLAQEVFQILSAPVPDPTKLDQLHTQARELCNLIAPLSKQLRSLRSTVARLEAEKAAHYEEIVRIKNTVSWNITKPVRYFWNTFLKP